MPPSTHTAAPHPAPAPNPDPLIQSFIWLPEIEDDGQITVLGGLGPDLMCALLRAGAANVTHLRAHERPEAASASLVIVPRVPSLDWLAVALLSIRRALLPHGRLVVCAGSRFITQTQIRRMLSRHGFITTGTRGTADEAAISAELPALLLRKFA